MPERSYSGVLGLLHCKVFRRSMIAEKMRAFHKLNISVENVVIDFLVCRCFAVTLALYCWHCCMPLCYRTISDSTVLSM